MNTTAQLLSSCHFSELPFHPVPRPGQQIWAGSTETKSELLRIVNEVRHDSVELSHLVLVYGEYGSGKTHALRYLVSEVRKTQSIVAYFAMPKVEKKASFEGIAKEAIKQIGERPLRQAAEPIISFIREESRRLASESIDLASVKGSLDQYVKKKADDFKRSLQEEINPQFPELLQVLEGLVDEDPSAWRYFTGKPTASSLSSFGVSPIEDDHDALRVLSGIYRVLTTRYPQIPNTPVYDAVYLLIDEMEQLLDLKNDEILSLRTGLRDLFNACTEHFCLILAATAENASLFHGVLEEALMVRITAAPVHIVSHDAIDDGVRFIRELMGNYRSGPPPNPYHPFTEAGLRTLVDRTGLPRTARKLIANCRRAWEQSSNTILSGGTIGEDEVNSLVGLV